MSCTDS